MTNRERFLELVEPLFAKSKYCLTGVPGKNASKIIEIVERETGECDFSIWCHSGGNRLDLVAPNWRIRQIQGDYNLENQCRMAIKTELHGKPATSFRYMDEGTLITICQHMADIA